jgi:hypothetical protein
MTSKKTISPSDIIMTLILVQIPLEPEESEHTELAKHSGKIDEYLNQKSKQGDLFRRKTDKYQSRNMKRNKNFGKLF